MFATACRLKERAGRNIFDFHFLVAGSDRFEILNVGGVFRRLVKRLHLLNIRGEEVWTECDRDFFVAADLRKQPSRIFFTLICPVAFQE